MTVRQVNRNGNAKALGFIVNRIIERIRHHALALERPHAYADSAMLLGKTHLWNRLTGRQRRNYASPSQSIFTVFPDIRQPPVPTPAQRNLSVGPRGQGREPKRVVKHLDVNAERIHMAQSLMYIGKLTGFYWCRYLPAEFF